MDQIREVVIRDYQATSTKLYKISLIQSGAEKIKEYVRYIFLSLITLSIYYFLDKGTKPTKDQIDFKINQLGIKISNPLQEETNQNSSKCDQQDQTIKEELDNAKKRLNKMQMEINRLSAYERIILDQGGSGVRTG